MKIQIPKNLPQFKEFPALFISSGEFEAHFYSAFQGSFEELESVKMPPNTETAEKQGFIKESRGKTLGSLSHHRAYVEDLRKRFSHKVDNLIHELIDEYQFQRIFLYAPTYVAKRIIKGLEPAEEDKIKMKFFGEYTKLHPLKMIKMFWEKIEILISSSLIIPPISNEGEKIFNKPRIRRLSIRGA